MGNLPTHCLFGTGYILFVFCLLINRNHRLILKIKIQVINYQGCYDNNGEWLVMDNIQLVCTLNLNHSQGRFQLSSRFISLLRVAVVGYAQWYNIFCKHLKTEFIHFGQRATFKGSGTTYF